MIKVFIDGKAGTTGLRIYERLSERPDIEIITLPEEERKSPEARKKALNSCDVAFLCLPDDAAREAVAMIENENVIVIDASTAHRTNPAWCYGFPELSSELENKLKTSKRIAVPGCHASGFIALVYPLVEKGIISKDALLSCHSLTGYSGGGKKMIGEYEDDGRDYFFGAPRQYGLTQTHKHLPEMKAITGIENAPAFCPIVADFYSGMLVTVPLFKSQIKAGYSLEDIKNVFKEKYNSELVKYEECLDSGSMASANMMRGRDSMRIAVYGNDDRIILTALYDNLGKGASGAAIQCMNMAFGVDKTTGLVV